jgi:hypothetical protein
MKSIRAVIISFMFILVPAAAAHATTLVSPALAVSSTQTLFCQIVNAGDSTEAVDIAIMRIDGDTLKSSAETLGAGEVKWLTFSGDSAGILYCRFTILGKSKTGDVRARAGNFRASISTVDASGNTAASLSAY